MYEAAFVSLICFSCEPTIPFKTKNKSSSTPKNTGIRYANHGFLHPFQKKDSPDSEIILNQGTHYAIPANPNATASAFPTPKMPTCS